MSVFAALLVASLFAACNGDGTVVNSPNINWDYSYPYQPASLGTNSWFYGSATYYSFTGNSGACGHPFSWIDGIDTAAVPDRRWGDILTPGVSGFHGAACGSCYYIKCIDVPRYGHTVFCKNHNPIKIRVIDYDVPGSGPSQGWPNNHFDLKPETFAKIALPSAGEVNVKFKRTSCGSGSPVWKLAPDSQFFWKDVIVYKVPSPGTVISVYGKPPSRSFFIKGQRKWGAHYSFLTGAAFTPDTIMKVTLAENKGTQHATHSS